MTRKLFSFATGECCEESADSPAYQEVCFVTIVFISPDN